MKSFLIKGKDNKQDLLSIEIEISSRNEYKNISKHKRVLMPVIKWCISLDINGHKLDKDEVFVEDVFLNHYVIRGITPCLPVLVVFSVAEGIMWMLYMIMKR